MVKNVKTIFNVDACLPIKEHERLVKLAKIFKLSKSMILRIGLSKIWESYLFDNQGEGLAGETNDRGWRGRLTREWSTRVERGLKEDSVEGR